MLYLIVFDSRMRVDVQFEVSLLVEAFPANSAPEGVVVLMDTFYVSSGPGISGKWGQGIFLKAAMTGFFKFVMAFPRSEQKERGPDVSPT